MYYLDYEMLCEEIIEKLSEEKSITLATANGTKVTARVMSHVNDGLNIMVQTSKNSEKVAQIKQNPCVALALSNVQIEAIATPNGHPLDEKNQLFAELYKKKFPKYFNKFTPCSDEIVLCFQLEKIALYKYIADIPCKDIVDVAAQIAYRVKETENEAV